MLAAAIIARVVPPNWEWHLQPELNWVAVSAFPPVVMGTSPWSLTRSSHNRRNYLSQNQKNRPLSNRLGT
jgi:dihydrofolate reductase